MIVNGNLVMNQFCWDDELIEHLAEHGVSAEEFEHIYETATLTFRSRTTGNQGLMGFAPDGRCLVILFECVRFDGLSWVTPITAYENEKV